MASAVTGLALDQISRRHGDAPALATLDLMVARGELVAITGPSGCGKTTALRIVAGLDAPTTGRVWIDGRDVTAAPPGRRDVAIVPQGHALYPHLTVFENVAFALRARRVSDDAIASRVAAVAEALGIVELLARRAAHLSGGQRQRVAIARAVAAAPRVLLLDEPLAHLDARPREALRGELARLHRAIGATTLYVTHDERDALAVADRVVVLRDGAVQQVGTPREIVEQPANGFVAEFFARRA